MQLTFKNLCGVFVLFPMLILSVQEKAFSDHTHALSQVITNDSALQDLSFDVVAAVLTTDIQSISLSNREYEAQIKIEEVFRGKSKKDEQLKVLFKELRPMVGEISEEVRTRASLVKLEDLKLGDRIIICLQAGPPAVANSGAIYGHNSVSNYQVKQQMAHESFLSRHFSIWWIIFILVLLFLLKKFFR